jgi:hypothetical protein
MVQVVIGVDPHKLSATLEVVDRQETLLGSGRFGTDKAGYQAMRSYVRAWPDRVWAVEGANGAGRPLAQRLLEAGEHVVDDASSGDQIRHRLSRAGNRRMNHVIHIAAIVQIRHDTEGRAYYRRKLADGKTPMEALRCLKRRLSDVIYRRLVADAHAAQSTPAIHEDAGPGGHCGATQQSSAADLPPHIDTSDQPLPGPATTQPKRLLIARS